MKTRLNPTLRLSLSPADVGLANYPIPIVPRPSVHLFELSTLAQLAPEPLSSVRRSKHFPPVG